MISRPEEEHRALCPFRITVEDEPPQDLILRFVTLGNESIEKYPQEDVALWDDTRKAVNDWFQSAGKRGRLTTELRV